MAEAPPIDFGSSGAPVAMPAAVRSRFPWIALFAAVALHLALFFPASVFGPRPDPRVSEPAKPPEPIAIEMVTEAALKARSEPLPPATPPPAAPVEDIPLPQDLTLGSVPPQAAAPAQTPPLDLTLALPDNPEASAAGQLSQSLQAFQKSLTEAPKAGAKTTAKSPVDTYSVAVRQALMRRMPAPPGRSGNVELTLVLSETGTPVDVKLARSSGIPAFDAAAINAVWSCACPKAPAGSTQADRTIDVEVNF